MVDCRDLPGQVTVPPTTMISALCNTGQDWQKERKKERNEKILSCSTLRRVRIVTNGRGMMGKIKLSVSKTRLLISMPLGVERALSGLYTVSVHEFIERRSKNECYIKQMRFPGDKKTCLARSSLPLHAHYAIHLPFAFHALAHPCFCPLLSTSLLLPTTLLLLASELNFCFLPESGCPSGPSRAPWNIIARLCVCVCLFAP